MYEQQVLNYLDEINNNIYENRNNLQEIKEDVEHIRNSTQEQISGDIQILQNQEDIKNMIGLEALIIMAILLYLFIVRCFK